MKNKVLAISILIFMLGIFFTPASSHAGNIKSRMKARLPIIKALKAKGIIGENNRGYLQFLGNKKEKENEVKAENSDRNKVYSAIAKQEKTTIEDVEKHRAARIGKIAEPGTRLQDANGKWYQKK